MSVVLKLRGREICVTAILRFKQANQQELACVNMSDGMAEEAAEVSRGGSLEGEGPEREPGSVVLRTSDAWKG